MLLEIYKSQLLNCLQNFVHIVHSVCPKVTLSKINIKPSVCGLFDQTVNNI